MIPAKIIVDGSELPASSFTFTVSALPSFDGWRVLRGTVAIPGGALYLQVFGRKDFGLPHTLVPETVLLANVTDRIVHVRAELDGFGLGQSVDERVLSPYSGAGFSSESVEVLNHDGTNAANSTLSNKYDAQFAKSAKTPDVKVTRYTGSAGIDFFLPEAWWIDAGGGISPSAFHFFEAHRTFNDRRPIWWIHSDPSSPFVGMPFGLFDPSAKLAGFGEWDENAEGLNAYDVHHVDFDEVGEGALRFEHPAYFSQLLARWYHARANASYWRRDPSNNYGGAMRIFGGLMVATSYLVRVLVQRIERSKTSETGAFLAMLNEVLEFGAWHVANYLAKFPIENPWYHGSGLPAELVAAKLNYFQDWQFARAAFGLQRWVHALNEADVLPAVVPQNDRALDAMNARNKTIKFIENAYEQHGLCYLRTVDGTIKSPGDPIGAPAWCVAPLVQREIESGVGIGELGKKIATALFAAYPSKDKDRRLVRLLGPLSLSTQFQKSSASP